MSAITTIRRELNAILTLGLLLAANGGVRAQTLPGSWESELYRVRLEVAGTTVSGTFTSSDDPQAPPGRISGEVQPGGRMFVAEWTHAAGPETGSFRTLLMLRAGDLLLSGYRWTAEAQPTAFALHRGGLPELVDVNRLANEKPGETPGGGQAVGQQPAGTTTGGNNPIVRPGPPGSPATGQPQTGLASGNNSVLQPAKPPTTQPTAPATVTGSVVMCQQVDEQRNPINPGTVMVGPMGAAGAAGSTPDTVRAVGTFRGVPAGGVVECVWKQDGQEFARNRVTVPAGVEGWVWRWGPQPGGLRAGNYGVALAYAGKEIAQTDFQIVPGPPGPAAPATATTPTQVPVQGDNLLTPASLPDGLRLPTGTAAQAFAVPFDLGRPFFGPRDELFLLTCDRTVGMILHVPSRGVMRKVCEAAPLRGSNFRGAAYRDGRFVVAVDYAPAGGSSAQGVHEVMLDGSSRPWPLQRDCPGLGDLIPAPRGGFYIADFEKAEGIFHLTAQGQPEAPLVARNWPGGIMRLAYDPTQQALYALNWGRDGWGGAVNGVYRLVGDELQLVSQAPAGRTFDDLAISSGGAFPAGLYVTDFGNGQVLRLIPGGAPVPVITGLHQPDYIGFVPGTGELMIVCKPKHLLWVTTAR